MRKTALLSGVAGLFLLTAPAFAQDGSTAQTPPSPEAGQAQAPTLSLQPGATVRGSDGDLGLLVGARMNDGRQQLTVQGEDGQVRAVAIDGIHMEGDVVVVDFTLEQYASAEVVAQPPVPATPAIPDVPPVPDVTPAVPEVGADAEAEAEAEAEVEAEGTTPPLPTPPTLPPEGTAVPLPGATPGAGVLPGKPD